MRRPVFLIAVTLLVASAIVATVTAIYYPIDAKVTKVIKFIEANGYENVVPVRIQGEGLFLRAWVRTTFGFQDPVIILVEGTGKDTMRITRIQRY